MIRRTLKAVGAAFGGPLVIFAMVFVLAGVLFGVGLLVLFGFEWLAMHPNI